MSSEMGSDRRVAATTYDRDNMPFHPGEGPQNAPPRNSEVSAEMAGIGDSMSHLHQAISRLEERLCPVLRASVPTPDTGNEGRSEPQTPLGGDLRTYKVQIYNLAQWVDDIRDRCEL